MVRENPIESHVGQVTQPLILPRFPLSTIFRSASKFTDTAMGKVVSINLDIDFGAAADNTRPKVSDLGLESVQAHHLIPKNVAKTNTFLKMLTAFGLFDMTSISNLMWLPQNALEANELGLAKHTRQVTKYELLVSDAIAKIQSQFIQDVQQIKREKNCTNLEAVRQAGEKAAKTIVTFDEMVALAQTVPSPLFKMSARGFRPVEHGVMHPAFLPTGATVVACGNRLVA
jgi:hypothetical protein